MDWDTIQNHAVFVETNLLRQLSVIYLGQELEISITPSISVTLQVEKIEYGPLQSSSSNGYVAKVRETRRTLKEIARINSDTELLVNPSIPSSSSSSTLSRNTRLAGISSTKPGLIEDQIQENSSNGLLSLIDLRKISQSLPLRVLPQRYRHQDISLFSQAAKEFVTSSSSQAVDELNTKKETELKSLVEDDNYLNSFLSNPSSPDDSVYPKTRKTLVSSSSTTAAAEAQFIWQVSDNYLDFSVCHVCNAFIHPLYLKTIIERQLKLSSPTSLLSEKDLEEFISQQSYPFLGMVRRIKPKHEVPSSSFLNEYLVRVYLTEKILPFSISLPSVVEKSLSVAEYDLTTLEIRTRFRSRFPVSVSLQPIIWEDRQDDSLDNQEKKENTKDMESLLNLPQNNVIDAFLKFLSRQSQKDSSYLLTHNSLISLTLNPSTFSTSSISSSFEQLLKSSPLKLTETGNELNPSFSQDFLIKFSYDSTMKKGSRKSGRSNPLVSPRLEDLTLINDEFSLAYLPLSYDNGIEEDCLYQIISSLQIEMNYPVRGFLSNKSNSYELTGFSPFPPCAILSSAFTMVGIEKIHSQILQELSLQFSSFYVFHQLNHIHSQQQVSVQRNPRQSLFRQLACHNYLITGEIGTGKTTFLHLLQRELTTSYQVALNQIHVELIDMKELLSTRKGQSSSSSLVSTIPEIISQFHHLFDRCKYYSPTILLIDNLDYLCSSINNPGGSRDGNTISGKSRKSSSTSNGSPILRDERLLILSTYFIRLLNDYYEFLEKKYERNTALLDLFLSSNSDSSSSKESEKPSFWKETVITACLQHSLFIIATAESLSSLDHLLIKNNEFRKEGIPLVKQEIEGESTFEDKKRKILLKVQSYRYYDFHYLISKILSKEIAYRLFLLNNDDASSSNLDSSISFSCTMEDLENAVNRYIPLSLQNNNQFSPATSSSMISPSSVNPNHAISLIETSSYFSAAYSQMIEIFRYPVIYSKLYSSLPLKLPHAIMLYGEPGCGKSYLASQIGKEFQLSTGNSSCGFLTIRGPQLLNKYIGESEKSIRLLFQLAKQQIKSTKQSVLIFFDEFESLAPKRGKDNTGITDRIVNQLLTFIDGVESTLGGKQRSGKEKKLSEKEKRQGQLREPNCIEKEGDAQEVKEVTEDEDDEDEKVEGQIFILIATSRPDLIDPALLRPGRIEKHIYIGFPETSKQYEELLLSMIEPYLPAADVSSQIAVKEKQKHTNGKVGENEDEGNSERLLMKEIIRKISNDSKIFRMTLADLKAIIDTAYLKAVHQKISSLSISATFSSSDSSNADDRICITTEILFQAFQETKPSIHESDRIFFDQIYSKFKKSSKNEKITTAFMEKGSNHSDDAKGNEVNHHVNGHEKNGKKKSKAKVVQETSSPVTDISKDDTDDIDRIQKLSFR
jgi:SpoVK/Ycf46/Vps4 family AAA+-type ATPase